MKKQRVAVVGATGLVGQTIGAVLEERNYPVLEYIPLATDASKGRQISAFDATWTVRRVRDVGFDGVDLCFFTAGAPVSRELVPRALDEGCRVVDNTTAYRMEPDVPLVVPEINGAKVGRGVPLVSCPNCTTIILVMTLSPLLRAAAIDRVVVTSFQSVSGAGREAVQELESQTRAGLRGEKATASVFPKPIAFNCLPKVGELAESGFTSEEGKIIEETRKILGRPDIEVVPTAVRVPVHVGHSISVNVEFSEELGLDRAVSLWREAPGVDFDEELPTALDVAGTDTVAVGRLRRDPTRPSAISYWAVGDNLRKGAATNSVQIAELMSLDE